MRNEMNPEYRMVQEVSGKPTCKTHIVQNLVDCYNDPMWEMEAVDTDKIQLTCRICKCERVYQLMPEKTLL